MASKYYPKQAGTTNDTFDVGINKLRLDASNLTAVRTLKFPDSNGTSGQVLSTDGSGNLSWIAALAGTNYVLKAGDTMTGTLTLNVTGTALTTPNVTGVGPKLTIQPGTGTGIANGTGGNGYIELIGAGGTSVWTNFQTPPVNRQRRGGILLQSGLAALDASGTYANGSAINIIGSNGTTNGTAAGSGGTVLLQAGSGPTLAGVLSTSGTITLTGGTTGSAGPASITSGSAGVGTGLPGGNVNINTGRGDGAGAGGGFNVTLNPAGVSGQSGAMNISAVTDTSTYSIIQTDASANLRLGHASKQIYMIGQVTALTTSDYGMIAVAPNGYTSTMMYLWGQTAASTGWYLLRGSDANVDTFVVYGNGNVQNTNNSYGALSDLKLKENICDATPKLAELNQLRVCTYNLKGSDTKQIGLIAQEVEPIFPSIVEEIPDRDRETNQILDTTTKSIKYSVFVPMLIKAVQELTEQVDSLKQQIADIKSA